MELTEQETFAIAATGVKMLPYVEVSKKGYREPGGENYWEMRVKGRLTNATVSGSLTHNGISAALSWVSWGMGHSSDRSIVLNPYHHLIERPSANVRKWVARCETLDPETCMSVVLVTLYGPGGGAQMYAETMYLRSEVDSGAIRPHITPAPVDS